MDVLDDLVHSYNNTYHRSIGMAPLEVDSHNENVVRARLYPLKPKFYKRKYRIGDKVCIAMSTTPILGVGTTMSLSTFRKGYLGNWWEEIFEIAS